MCFSLLFFHNCVTFTDLALVLMTFTCLGGHWGIVLVPKYWSTRQQGSLSLTGTNRGLPLLTEVYLIIHISVTYILTTAWVDTAGQRWITSLANYNSMLHYGSGKSNVNADTLSRIPLEESKIATLNPKAFKAIVGSCLLQTKSLSVAEAYISPQAVKALLATDVVETPNKFTSEQWKAAQRSDAFITQMLDYLQKKPDTTDRKSLSDETCGMLKQKDKLILRSDLLYRQCTSQFQDQPMYQFMIPMKYWQQALTTCHDGVGHCGFKRISCLIKDQFYSPHMDWMSRSMFGHVLDVKDSNWDQKKPKCLQLSLLIHWS